MKWYRAQDTFTADLEGGGQRTVTRGQTLPESDDMVKLDAGRGHLFELVDAGEPEAKAEKPAPKPRLTARSGQ